MGTFAEFIESDAFFPVLILLLMLLMFTFVSILMSGRTKEKKKMQERKKIQLDESAQIQLVQHDSNVVVINNVPEEPREHKETGSTEVGLVKEVEAVDLSEVEEELEEMRVTIEENPDKEIEVPSFNQPIEDVSEEYVVEHQDTLAEELNESEIVKVELTEQIGASNDIGEEIIVPKSKMEDESNEEPVIEADKSKVIEENDAFEMNANEDHTINENVDYEPPKEYDGDKTEILDFPDFDFIDDDKTQKIETQIINQANKYIESVMESRETNEE